MFAVELICSDEACAEVTEATVFSLREIEVLTCASCGCTLQALSTSEVSLVRPSIGRERQMPRAA